MAEDHKRKLHHGSNGSYHPNPHYGQAAASIPPATPQQQQQPGRPHPQRSAPTGMMRFVDSFMSPFVQCWQPPIDACVGMNSSCADMSVCGSGPARRPPPPVYTGTDVATTPSNRPAMVTPMAASPSPFQYSTNNVPPPTQGQPLQTRRVLTHIENPTEMDVICGRGGSSNKHNLHFRELIAANKATYTTLTKKQKMLLSKQVVETVIQAGGRFLAKDAVTGLWNDVGFPRAVEKASQALREKSTNNAALSDVSAATDVVVSEEAGGIEVEASSQSEQPKVAKLNPRTVEAPPLVIPDVYKQKANPGPASGPPFHRAEYPPPEQTYSQQPYRYHGSAPQSYHPPERATHIGAFPFTSRQLPRANRMAHPVVSPASHGMPWNQHNPPPAYMHHVGATSTGRPGNPIAFSPEYPTSDIASCHYQSDSTITHSAPESHQYYQEIQPPMDTSSAAVNAYEYYQYPHPYQEGPPEVKRQRTKEEEAREQNNVENEEDSILFDDNTRNNNNENAFSLQDTSLTEGSHQLPAEIESRLSLQEKVISPSGLMQSRSPRNSLQRHTNILDSPTIPKVRDGPPSSPTGAIITNRLNTSAEAEGLAGLAALSTAAFLKMDEGE